MIGGTQGKPILIPGLGVANQAFNVFGFVFHAQLASCLPLIQKGEAESFTRGSWGRQTAPYATAS